MDTLKILTAARDAVMDILDDARREAGAAVTDRVLALDKAAEALCWAVWSEVLEGMNRIREDVKK